MAPLRPTGPDHSTSPAHLTGPGHSENPGHPTDPGRPTNPAHPTGPVLTTPERRFLNAALAARDAERRAAARIGRRHRVLTGALITVLAVAMSTAFVVRREYEAARTQRIHSAARRVADVADALRTTDPRTALLLGAAAWRIAGLPETRRALLGSLDQAETDTFTDPAPGDGPYRALADGGHTLVSADGTAWHTWDVPGRRATGSGRVPAGTVTAAGADGRLLAVTGADGRVRLWNTTTRRWAGPAPRAAVRPSFTRDGRAVLTTEGDRVRLRRAGDGRVLFETTTTRPALTALGADGRRVAVCPAGGAPRLWDTATGRALPGAWQRDRLCDDTGFLALTDGRLAAGTDRGFRVWNTATGTRLADTDDKDTQDASFSPDGAFLATADTTELRVWRLTDPALPVFRHALGNQHLYGGLVWDDDGHTLRYLEGATVHTVDAGTAVTTAWGPPADGVRLSPDGRAYAVARRTGGHYTVTLRATSDGRLLRTLPPAAVPVSTDPALPVDPAGTLPLLAFSPDGTRFAYGVSAPPAGGRRHSR
ncbi:hypothetical protein IAG44_03685 [Streptomyces roseirectus]|uniref:WD40 repeat domain-containing protein n=1 Tax=Streptomyces roseirectus TaxID=2768066 RepID=A0A7H0I787_9ACTN|nr:hypothetical protein [Streptomyces roseirectus]QNP68653.1 hypothetical protein IAG44_03685 [Streptomyces roseirectus]